ncbi:hypothetical protein [Klebsiella phage vB_KpnM_17-11]|jgi:hypothetical protein|nr:hypothetical protein [Klebsiella phage vB_KpnM_17-11]WKW88674.1 hypothetical protein pzkkv61_101 [Klebsiella phage pzk-kv6-1]
MNVKELRSFVETRFSELGCDTMSRHNSHRKVLESIRDLNPGVYDTTVAGKIANRVMDGMAHDPSNTVNFFMTSFTRSRWLGAMSATSKLGQFMMSHRADNKLYRYDIVSDKIRVIEEPVGTAAEQFSSAFRNNLRRILNRSISTLRNADRVKYAASANTADAYIPGHSQISINPVDEKSDTVRIAINSRWTNLNFPAKALRAQVYNALNKMKVVKEIKRTMVLDSSTVFEATLDEDLITPTQGILITEDKDNVTMTPKQAKQFIMDTDVQHMYMNPPPLPMDHVSIAKRNLELEVAIIKDSIEKVEVEIEQEHLTLAGLQSDLRNHKMRLNSIQDALDLL